MAVVVVVVVVVTVAAVVAVVLFRGTGNKVIRQISEFLNRSPPKKFSELSHFLPWHKSALK